MPSNMNYPVFYSGVRKDKVRVKWSGLVLQQVELVGSQNYEEEIKAKGSSKI